MAFDVFTDENFNFKVQCMLGELRTGCGDAGEIMSTAASIADGDADSWVTGWRALAERVEKIAVAADTTGHDVSAREAYLRASAYHAAVLELVDGAHDPDAVLGPVFAAHRRCFHRYGELLDPPIERLEIPYEGSHMPGWFVPAPGEGRRRTLILNNGSDGAVTSLLGVALAAQTRGYHSIIFDGPGQQSMLFERNVPFRADWEAVITPVVDHLLAREDVDPDRLCIYGISQAGYWVPRALAFEHRLAAAVVDPGVDDVSTSWMGHLPEEMLEMLDKGDRSSFDQWMQIGQQDLTPAEKQEIAWRAKPYGIADPFDLFTAVRTYRLTPDVLARITTPVLITDPEGEQFWQGQAERMHQHLPSSDLVRFTAAEGADRHCEPMARSLLEQRMFDWLDSTLGVSAGGDS